MRFHKKYFFATVLFTLISASLAEAATKPKKKTEAAASSASSASSAPSTSSAAAATSAAAAAAAPAKGEAKAVDFSAKDLWDKSLFDRDDNKVLVIQDRKYNKGKRLELGADLGMTAATAFYNSYTVGIREAYYLNEYWGIQSFQNYSLNTATNEKNQLENYLSTSGFKSTKEFLQPRTYLGLGVLWNPIYGKFAWFKSRIIHFDIYGGAGVSFLSMDSTFNKPAVGQGAQRKGSSQWAPGTLLNLGIRIFISKHLAWTTEARNNIYQAKYQATTSGGGTTPIGSKKVIQNNFQFVTGVSYLFNLGGY